MSGHSGSASRTHDLFAVTAHGLEHICAMELAALGMHGKAETGGVAWRGDVRSLYRANLELRTASRVIARVGEFRARGFAELERHAARLPWTEFLREGASVSLRVTCRKSKLYHERAVAERVARVLTDRAGAVVESDTAADDDDAGAVPAPDSGAGQASRQSGSNASTGQLVIVRFLRDVCTISVDSSGALLHQRGYRQAIARAPLRETMAAALVLASGWDRSGPLLDPFCGSGTIPIEAALLARDIAPGIATSGLQPRAYAFELWPHFDEQAWNELVMMARNAVRDGGPAIAGSDRDAGAITAARSNADRAGVAGDIAFSRLALDRLPADARSGHIITNPPYGVRVGERRSLHALYASLGRIVRERMPAREVTLLAADDMLAAGTGLPLTEVLTTRNGGIPVRLLTTAHHDAGTV